MAEERTLWKGSPSHAVNFWLNVICGLLFWLVVPLVILIYKWLQTRCRSYELTTERLKLQEGILSKRLEEIELYRVRDSSLEEPFLLRMFGAGNVILQTTDATSPQIVLQAVPQARAFREHLRSAVEAIRDRKRVRTIEDDDAHEPR